MLATEPPLMILIIPEYRAPKVAVWITEDPFAFVPLEVIVIEPSEPRLDATIGVYVRESPPVVTQVFVAMADMVPVPQVALLEEGLVELMLAEPVATAVKVCVAPSVRDTVLVHVPPTPHPPAAQEPSSAPLS